MRMIPALLFFSFTLCAENVQMCRFTFDQSQRKDSSQTSFLLCRTFFYFLLWLAEKKINIHFSAPLDNICHSSPQAYSDWACRVNRSKLTQISQGSPDTLWQEEDRGESEIRLFSSIWGTGEDMRSGTQAWGSYVCIHTQTSTEWSTIHSPTYAVNRLSFSSVS